jgi:hypothetical protein
MQPARTRGETVFPMALIVVGWLLTAFALTYQGPLVIDSSGKAVAFGGALDAMTATEVAKKIHERYPHLATT